MPVPVTQIRTSHAISIKAGGQVIGQIQSWGPHQSRDVRTKYEINAVGTGAIAEQIPGNQTGQTLQVVRFDLYKAKMEEVWGLDRPMLALCDQQNPFDVEEKWIKYGDDAKGPWEGQWGVKIKNENWSKYNTSYMLNSIGNTKFGKTIGFDSTEDLEEKGIIPAGVPVTFQKYRYAGCWFSQMGRTISADGARIVVVSATLSYTKVRSVL
jgi:hypothetical protein